MVVNKTLLPDKNSEVGKEIVDLFPTASVGQLNEWASRLGYRNKKNFIDSVRNIYGITRLDGKNEGWEPTEINTPIEIITTSEPQTVAVINDLQIPYQDQDALNLVENFLGEIQPNLLLYNGDIMDWYELSDFDKDPARVNNLQPDIDVVKAMLRRHKITLPNTRKLWFDGNHERRLQHFLWTKAPAISSLSCLTTEKLFNFEEYKIEHIAYEQGVMINRIFLVLHGDISSIHSGYTAKRMFEKHGGCGICGHCHRLGSYYKRDRFGFWGWWENGCLCHLNPDWIKNPNWTQGFSLVHFLGDRFWVEQIPIIKKKMMYGGKLYG